MDEPHDEVPLRAFPPFDWLDKWNYGHAAMVPATIGARFGIGTVAATALLLTAGGVDLLLVCCFTWGTERN